ncbi:hypothetical protein AC249_AIPGENE28820 [Exaiptasia diaphana]|nr:hypothetical protein AC249_AIPGENE28820 [Exaiptasia diaphana]
MAEKEANYVEEPKSVEEEKKEEGENGEGFYDFIGPENTEGNGQDEVDAGEGIPKRKRSGILGRMSNRRKKKKSSSKEKIYDEGKNDSNVEVNEKATDEVEEKITETEENIDKTIDDKQEDETKNDAVKEEVCEAENNESKKKKPGRLRRLSISKMIKGKKQNKKENNDDNEGTENKDDCEKDDANCCDSTKVQNEQEKCDVPETCDQSEDSMESNQPITDDIKAKKEQGKSADELEKESADSANNAPKYYSSVVQMPADIALKALQTIKQVFKPVLLYIIRKNPHCFKEIIENNKKTTCGPTQV